MEKLHKGEGESPDLDKLQKSLQKATDNSSGETAAILRGSQSYLKRMQAVQETYTVAGRQITSAHILQPSDIRQRADLQAKTKIVQEFIAANRAFSAFLSANEENYRKDLVQANVSPRALEAALKGFRQKAAAQTPHLLKIRETDQDMGEGMLNILKLLDGNWAQWRYDANKQIIRFDSPAALKDYNAC